MARSVTPSVIFTRSGSIAGEITRRVARALHSVDAALYRFNQLELARVLGEASRRGLSVRLVLDRQKYEQDQTTQQLLREHALSFRLIGGLRGSASKMHHKFVILDGETALTGSYNWTRESEDENYDNLAIFSDPEPVAAYRAEFGLLWGQASPVSSVEPQNRIRRA